MTNQPRDLAAEAEEIRKKTADGIELGLNGQLTLLLHIAALSREIEELRRPLAELKKEAESEEGMEPQRMMQYLCRRVDALQKATRRLQPDNERLRAENEQLREQVRERPDQEAIDMAVSRAVLAERELASLRTENERLQKANDILDDTLGLQDKEIASLRAANERLKLELEISWDDLPGAIDALDDVIPQGCKQLLRQCAKDLRALRAHTAAAQADSADIARRLMDQAKEIIRLSSPPPERAEIVERQSMRKQGVGGQIRPGCAVDDIDTLLQDLARARNARHVYRAQRDLHQARKDLVVELRAKCERAEHEACALTQRIERLEGALQRVPQCQFCDAHIDAMTALATPDVQHNSIGGEIATLKRALAWAVENSPSVYYDGSRQMKFLDATTGDEIEVPEEFDELIKAAALAETDAPALSASQQHTAGSGDGVAGD